MAERIESAFFGLFSSAAAAWLIYELAIGRITGPGYAVLAAVSIFGAVGHACRLALHARLPFVTVTAHQSVKVSQASGDSKGGEKR